MRGLARAVVGLLQTGVDFAWRRGQFTARRYVDCASCDGSVDVAGNDYHHATLGRRDTAAEPERLHELDATAGGLEHAAEISSVAGSSRALTAHRNPVFLRHIMSCAGTPGSFSCTIRPPLD